MCGMQPYLVGKYGAIPTFHFPPRLLQDYSSWISKILVTSCFLQHSRGYCQRATKSPVAADQHIFRSRGQSFWGESTQNHCNTPLHVRFMNRPLNSPQKNVYMTTTFPGCQIDQHLCWGWVLGSPLTLLFNIYYTTSSSTKRICSGLHSGRNMEEISPILQRFKCMPISSIILLNWTNSVYLQFDIVYRDQIICCIHINSNYRIFTI